MRSGELLQQAREAKGFKQADVAADCGISRSALGRYEVGTLRLSEDILLNIAPKLDLNPDFFQGITENPFKQQNDELIKFYVVNKHKVHVNELLTHLTARSVYLEIYCLSPPLTIIERIRHMNIADNPIYALLIKDEHGNVILFRCKSNKDYIAWDDTLISMYMKLFTMRDIKSNIEKQIISRELYEKIMAWDDLNKDDFASILASKNQQLKYKTTIYSEAENLMVNTFRDDAVNADVATRSSGLLRDLTRHNIDPEEAREIVRRHFNI